MESKMKPIKELVGECIIHLKQLGYSDSYVERHTQRWSNGIIPYMEEHNLVCYDPQIGEEYLQFASINMSSSSNIFRFRNIHMLDDLWETGDIRKKICIRVKYPLPNEIGEIAEQFLIDLKSLRQSELTISRHRRVLSYFITSLELKFIVKAENIQEENISDFIDAAQASKDHYYSTMKRFCRYLYANKITQRDLSYMINRSCLRTQNKLPSIYSIEEVQQIELSVEQSSYVGKRDYAILLLATRLGLRASDIANLTFSNLDWETNKIILTQYKTGKDIGYS